MPSYSFILALIRLVTAVYFSKSLNWLASIFGYKMFISMTNAFYLRQTLSMSLVTFDRSDRLMSGILTLNQMGSLSFLLISSADLFFFSFLTFSLTLHYLSSWFSLIKLLSNLGIREINCSGDLD